MHPSDSVEADARRWAIRTLGLGNRTEPFDAAMMLRVVTESVVPPEWADAVLVLANPEGLAAGSNIAALATQRGSEQRWEALVADFASEFFDLTPDQRGERWRVLMDECPQIPSLVPWVFNLALGIEITGVPSSTDERFNDFVQTCRQIFVTRPPANIRMRQEFMAMCRLDPDLWEAVAKELQSTDADFVRHVAPWIEDEFGDHRWRESFGEAKPSPLREPWSVPRWSIQSGRWSRFCEQCEKWTRLLLHLTIAGLVLVFVVSVVAGVLAHFASL